MSDSRVERNKAVFRLLLEGAMPNWPSRSVTVSSSINLHHLFSAKIN